MRTLLDERFAPITSSIGFLELPLDQVAAGLEQWRRVLGKNLRIERAAEGFPEVLHRLESLNSRSPRRELLVAAGRWTAYFDNSINGSDPDGPIGCLAETLGCQGVVIDAVPNMVSNDGRGPNRYGAVQFTLFGPLRTDWINYVRSVAVVNDDGWKFIATGTPQDFEEPGAYTARRIRDRFTSEMLERYCQALGIDVFNPDFYGPDAVLVEDLAPLPEKALVMTLAEAQRYHGIVPGVAERVPG